MRLIDFVTLKLSLEAHETDVWVNHIWWLKYPNCWVELLGNDYYTRYTGLIFSNRLMSLGIYKTILTN